MIDDDFEEWPIITMNSSNNNVDAFRMPSAEEVAVERERELECERELRRLREGETATQGGGSAPGGGDEEEETAALAHAVTALRVERAASPPSRRAALLADTVRRLPPAARALLDRPDIERHLPEVLSGVCAALRGWAPGAGAAPGAAEEDACVCAALCACALSAHWHTHARAARALHHVLDHALDGQRARAAGDALLAAMGTPEALLELSALLSGGAGPHTSELSARAIERALLATVGGRGAALPAVCAAWPALSPARSLAALQLVGRHLAGAAHAPPAPPLLAHTHAHDALSTHALKVKAAAARLRLLFRADAPSDALAAAARQ